MAGLGGGVNWLTDEKNLAGKIDWGRKDCRFSGVHRWKRPAQARRKNPHSPGGSYLFRKFVRFSTLIALGAAGAVAYAAQLSSDARTAIPRDVQQLVVIDYRAMQNSATAMQLRDRVMPPDLKQFDDALRNSGLNENHDVDQLAFALVRPSAASEDVVTIGIAQGQFPVQDIVANFRKKGAKPSVVRGNKIYPMGKTGMVLCFVDQSTMVFGGIDAVKASLDTRDGNGQSLLNNST